MRAARNHSALGRSGQIRLQRSCMRPSRLGQSLLSCSFHFINCPGARAQRSAWRRCSDPCEGELHGRCDLICPDLLKVCFGDPLSSHPAGVHSDRCRCTVASTKAWRLSRWLCQRCRLLHADRPHPPTLIRWLIACVCASHGAACQSPLSPPRMHERDHDRTTAVAHPTALSCGGHKGGQQALPARTREL
jgi:hypothetical protein